MTKAEFLKDVAHEVKMLKKHALPEEIAELRFSEFDPFSKSRCIYGQMTGDCRSGRAVDLIMSCCKRVVNNDFDTTGHKNPDGRNMALFTDVEARINGAPTRAHIFEGDSYIGYLSALETYIQMGDARNSNVISYLKGETKKLEL